ADGLEQTRRQLGMDVELPIAGALADLDEQRVLAGLEFEDDLVLVRGGGPVDVLGEDLGVVVPDGDGVIAAERERQLDGVLDLELMVDVNAGINVILLVEAREVVHARELEVLEFMPGRLDAALALVVLLQIDLALRRVDGGEALLVGVVERADVVPLAFE